MNLSNINSHALTESVNQGEYSFMESQYSYYKEGFENTIKSNPTLGKTSIHSKQRGAAQGKPGKSKFFKKPKSQDKCLNNQDEGSSDEFDNWEGEEDQSSNNARRKKQKFLKLDDTSTLEMKVDPSSSA